MIHRVLITGAGTGIGRAIALKLAQDGFNLTLHCNRSIASTNQTAAQIRESGRDVSVISADITDENAIRSAIESDISANGAYWGIVTNAGITADNAFPAMTSKEWTSVINTNLNGFYNVLNPCIMPMIRLRDGGRIVSISSVSGVIGNRGQTNYSASKAGIIAATKSLALELAKRKITIDTNIMTAELKEKIIPMIPLGRLGQPDEIASAVSFLFSDGASYITRQVININGGMC